MKNLFCLNVSIFCLLKLAVDCDLFSQKCIVMIQSYFSLFPNFTCGEVDS